MKRLCLYFISAVMSLGLVSCGGDNDTTEGASEDVPQVNMTVTDTKNSITTAEMTIPYHELLVSDGVSTSKPCLVLYLHGGTSAGNDNEKQMSEPGIDSITDYLKQQHKNAIMIVPQCPLRQYWIGPAKYVLNTLISQYVDDGKVDAKQIYIFGGSMGGTGTWGMLAAFPDLFAAAMPVAGDPSKVGEYTSKIPVLTVMGTADVLMNMQNAIDFIAQLKASGVDASIETEEGWTHEDTCKKSYTTQRLDKVFAHKKN